MPYAIESLDLTKKIDDTRQIGYNYSELSLIYQQLGNIERAQKYGLLSYEICKVEAKYEFEKLREEEKRKRLVNQIPDLAKLESGEMTATTKPADIVFCLKGIAASFESTAQRKGIIFRRSFDCENLVTDFNAAHYLAKNALLKIIPGLLFCKMQF